MRFFRLSKHRHARDSLSGAGAAQEGARWNSKDVPVAFFSTSISLAVLEIRAHARVRTPRMLELEVPDGLIEKRTVASLPKGWDAIPPTRASQVVGDQWIQARSSLGLLVPSAIVQREFNLLINPRHPAIKSLKPAEPVKYPLDRRLWE